MKPAPRLDFLKMGGIVPVVVQDDTTREVLMLAFINEEAWEKTLETGLMWYYSRKRNKLWMKGEQSGNVQRVRELRIDCDNDTVLAMVDQVGGACDLGYRSCFDKAVRDGELSHVGVVVFEPQVVYPYNETLRVAVPTGSLSHLTNTLIESASANKLVPLSDGRELTLPSHRSKVIFVGYDPREIPARVASGEVDAGITGFDILIEKHQDVVPLALLDYNKRGRGAAIWAIAVPESSHIENVHQLDGEEVVSELPTLTSEFLRRNRIRASVKGAVLKHDELFSGGPVAELIETGATLREYGYRPLAPMLRTFASLVANPTSYSQSWKRLRLEELAEMLLHSQSELPASPRGLFSFEESTEATLLPASDWDTFHAAWFTRFKMRSES